MVSGEWGRGPSSVARHSPFAIRYSPTHSLYSRDRRSLISRVAADGRARYTGILRERLAAFSPALAGGFHVRDLDEVSGAMNDLRSRLERSAA